VAGFIVLLEWQLQQADTHGAGDGREQVASGGVTNRILLLKHVISSRFLVLGRVTLLTYSASFLYPQKNCRYCIGCGSDEAMARALSGAACLKKLYNNDRDRNMIMNGG
jgi:hypothetical protein